MSMRQDFLIIGGLLLILIIGSVLWQVHRVDVAHSTFDNYYAFRGCTKLLDRTATYADCQTNTGQTIRMVDYQNQWYLDGDLPCPGPVLSLKYLACFI